MSPPTKSTETILKKIKPITDLPPVQNGVVSASHTPTIEEGILVDIDTEKYTIATSANLKAFFPEQVAERGIPKYSISGAVKNVLQSQDATEAELRDAFFAFLLKNGKGKKKFLDTSCSSTEKDKNGSHKYKESGLVDLLAELDEKANEKTRRIVRGLPVATTSQPGLAPLRNTKKDGTQIVMGEFKNADNYKEGNARTQCLIYLLGLLYWLRTVRGSPVEAVYGFYVCGVLCKGQNKENYTVGLLKLSAPDCLGEGIKADCLALTRRTGDLLPLQTLIHFLAAGRTWKLSEGCKAVAPMPSLFMLPTNLWKDDKNRSVVIHGTLSVVFRITAQGVKDLITDEGSQHFRGEAHSRDWKEYWSRVLGKIEEELQPTIANTNRDAKSRDTRFYLKVRSKNSAWSNNPMSPMHDVWDLLVQNQDPHGFRGLYFERPYVSQSFGLVVMHDRGCQLKDAPNDEEIFQQFPKVIKTAMFLCEHLPHGDVLPHNLVYDADAKTLTLIDIDEGVRKPVAATIQRQEEKEASQAEDPEEYGFPLEGEGAVDSGGSSYGEDERGLLKSDRILQRKNEYGKDGGNWYTALSYPNPLREAAYLYTKSQLIASFLFIMRKLGHSVPRTALESFGDFAGKAKSLGDKICELDKADAVAVAVAGDKNPDTEALFKMLEEAYEAMNKMLTAQRNS